MEIQLHSLILLWGPDFSAKHAWAQDHFGAHEIVTQAHIAHTLTGHTNSLINRIQIKEEIKHQVELRLSLGQQVVLILDHTSHVDVHAWADLCDSLAASMCVVLFNQKLTTSRVPCVRVDQVKFPEPNINKILAVGDVHGDYAAMKMAYDHARINNLHIVWLGDVLDYGDHNLKCVHLAYQSVKLQQAHMIWGNHERKIGKWLDAQMGAYYRGRMSEANQKTIREIHSLAPHRQKRFLAAWKFLEHQSMQLLRMGAWTFTHGAVHPDAGQQSSHRLTGVAGEWAYFGEVHTATPNSEGYPQRCWDWVNQLPAHAQVVVGHDWVDRTHMQVTVKTGSQGAQVWCVDTGSSKGGRLSALEIDLNTNKWETRVFTP
jgi:protein phosphatase